MKNIKQIIIIITILLSVLPLAPAKAAELYFDNIEIIKVDEDSIAIKWHTSVPTRGTIRFGIDSKSLTNYIQESGSARASTGHYTVLNNLKANSIYYYQIEATDGAKTITSYINEFDTDDYNVKMDAPKISDLEVLFVASKLAVVQWRTNIAATSYIEYGTGAYKKQKSWSDTPKTRHLATVKGLTPETKYNFKVYSTNADKITSLTHTGNFTTTRVGARNEGALIFKNIRPLSESDPLITSNSITLDFETNNAAHGDITIDSAKTKKIKYSVSYNLKHHIYFQDLTPNTHYTINISFTDVFGNKQKKTIEVRTDSEVNLEAINQDEYTYTEYDAGSNQTSESTNNSNQTGIDEGVEVLGAEHSYYSPANRLLKISGQADVYAIVNKQRYKIISEEAFKRYGYQMKDVKTVAKAELEKYPLARLVKNPDNNRIYFLWSSANGMKKISIPSPAVFTSYKSNDWSKVIKVASEDLKAIPDVSLVRADNNSAVFFLKDGKKFYVSSGVFQSKNFKSADILSISQTHLDAIASGGNYQ